MKNNIKIMKTGGIYKCFTSQSVHLVEEFDFEAECFVEEGEGHKAADGEDFQAHN
jgi:hypothetical protein